MKNRELARLFFRELDKLIRHPDLPEAQRLIGLIHLLELLFIEVTKEEKISFTTLFARITYACQKLGLSKQLQFFLHHFRKKAREQAEDPASVESDLLLLGYQVLADTIAAVFAQPVPEELQRQLPGAAVYPQIRTEVQEFRSRVRVVALRDEPEARQLVAVDESRPGEEVRVQYGIADRNDNFAPTIRLIRRHFGFPLQLNLIDVEIDREGVYRPRALVVEPDYLVDVTAVAECFKPEGLFLPGYLLRKFLPVEPNKYLMVGNIANFFLDELMTDPDQSFKKLFPQVFKLNPLAFALFDDHTVREIMQTSQRHYVHLREMVKEGFRKNAIEPAACFLEPTFYSEKYGLQGRLDIFHHQPGGQSAIVELKSGKTFRSNAYGINQNHFTQTLLYDLIVRSVYGKRTDPLNYILYSVQETDGLRFAPVVRAQQMEALQARNHLLAIERRLADLRPDGPLQPAMFDKLAALTVSGFLKRDVETFLEVYRKQSALERRYFLAFTGFIAREHQLAKTGVQGLQQVNGLASLWLSRPAEKEEQFEILRHLKVVSGEEAGAEEPIVRFRRTEQTNPLANFRRGDIAVLYPVFDEHASVLRDQVFKCTILNIDEEEITVRLRSRQFNTSLFESAPHWNLEHDMLDGGFMGMYRQLFAFMGAPQGRRALWLGQRPPQQPEEVTLEAPAGLTAEQADLFRRMINARDYFLLWGPPGTGKTSMMLREVVGHLWENTEESLLLLAYTNRAVDEICEAIEAYDERIREDYLRIGSRYSTDARFRENLLDAKTASVHNRRELRALLGRHRIYVSTVASISNRMELLQLKKFDRLILDEASQVLEPMLVGLLPRFPRAILIGDHRQLPAVVTQPEEDTRVEAPELRDIELTDLRDSLFERLYRLAQRQPWVWAYGRLTCQGRMHEAIMDFPNRHFYQNYLQILPSEIEQSRLQKAPPGWRLPADASPLERRLSAQRVLFLPARANEGGLTFKTNLHEAELIAQVLQAFQRLYASRGESLRPESVGVIAPYRAQIAQIRDRLQEDGLLQEGLTIDTVERYQGGARDIILISLCANHSRQLESLVNASTEGVDRKLNVALTRARQHLILIGNPDILRHNEIYRTFIEEYG